MRSVFHFRSEKKIVHFLSPPGTENLFLTWTTAISALVEGSVKQKIIDLIMTDQNQVKRITVYGFGPQLYLYCFVSCLATQFERSYFLWSKYWGTSIMKISNISISNFTKRLTFFRIAMIRINTLLVCIVSLEL